MRHPLSIATLLADLRMTIEKPSKFTCIVCGKPLGGTRVKQSIDGQDYCFDKQDCVTIFRRLERVYGRGFFPT